jgi:hypothetical protein
MSGLPWGKFFWKDWLTDPALSVCSLAAQGLWMRMLCIMSMSEPPGHFTLPPSRKDISEARQVARLCLADARLVRALLEELETRRVFSRNEGGTIVSRRMIRDAELSEIGRDAANRGWKKRKGPPKGGPNGKGTKGQAVGSQERNPTPRTDTDTESPPTRPRSRSRRRKQAAPTYRSGFGESVAADMQETDRDAKADDPPARSATVVPITRRLVGC